MQRYTELLLKIALTFTEV